MYSCIFMFIAYGALPSAHTNFVELFATLQGQAATLESPHEVVSGAAARAAWRRYASALYDEPLTSPRLPRREEVDVIYLASLRLGLNEVAQPLGACAPASNTPSTYLGRLPHGARELAYVARPRPVPFPAHASHSWVEIAHCGGSTYEAESSWFYILRGTGLWVNIGATIAFPSHVHAARRFLGRNCSATAKQASAAFQCGKDLSLIAKTARAQGFDSIQYVHHCDLLCSRPGSFWGTNVTGKTAQALAEEKVAAAADSHDAHSARMGPGVLHFCSALWCQCLRELWHSVPSAAQCQVHGRHSRSQASQCLDCG